MIIFRNANFIVSEPDTVPTGICIIAHAPLASAFKTCAQHIYSMTGDRKAERVLAYDVPSGVDLAEGVAYARRLIGELLAHADGVVVFTDLTGATPGNIARQLFEDGRVYVVSGTNLPAIVSALSAAPDVPAGRVASMAEAAARASLSSLIDRCD